MDTAIRQASKINIVVDHSRVYRAREQFDEYKIFLASRLGAENVGFDPTGTIYSSVTTNLQLLGQETSAQRDNKVNEIAGKGLSSNDYTSDEKAKLAGIATGANKTTVENVLTSTLIVNALSATQGKILNDKIVKPTIYDIPLSTSFVKDSGYYFKNSFSEVIVACRVDSTIEVLNGVLIGTLPAGFRPTARISVPARFFCGGIQGEGQALRN